MPNFENSASPNRERQNEVNPKIAGENRRFEDKYINKKNDVEDGLKKIKPKNLNVFKDAINESMQDEDVAEYEDVSVKADAVNKSLNFLGELKALQNKDKIFERLAKREIITLSEASELMDGPLGDIFVLDKIDASNIDITEKEVGIAAQKHELSRYNRQLWDNYNREKDSNVKKYLFDQLKSQILYDQIADNLRNIKDAAYNYGMANFPEDIENQLKIKKQLEEKQKEKMVAKETEKNLEKERKKYEEVAKRQEEKRKKHEEEQLKHIKNVRDVIEGSPSNESKERETELINEIMKEGGGLFFMALPPEYSPNKRLGFQSVYDSRTSKNIVDPRYQSPDFMMEQEIDEFVSLKPKEIDESIKKETPQKGLFGRRKPSKIEFEQVSRSANLNELIENGKDEPAYELTYVAKDSRNEQTYITADGRYGNMLLIRILLPKSLAQEALAQIKENPKFVREMADRLAVEHFNIPQKAWTEGDKNTKGPLRPPYEKWKNQKGKSKLYIDEPDQNRWEFNPDSLYEFK